MMKGLLSAHYKPYEGDGGAARTIEQVMQTGSDGPPEY
jgi:hypothetical protein